MTILDWVKNFLTGLIQVFVKSYYKWAEIDLKPV